MGAVDENVTYSGKLRLRLHRFHMASSTDFRSDSGGRVLRSCPISAQNFSIKP